MQALMYYLDWAELCFDLTGTALLRGILKRPLSGKQKTASLVMIHSLIKKGREAVAT